jgi:intracellular sulfur oxidation DsrE/DsrF family protein
VGEDEFVFDFRLAVHDKCLSYDEAPLLYHKEAMKITRKEAAASLLGLATVASAQTPAPKKHKIVMEMSVPGLDAWYEAVGHVSVLRDAFKDDAQIEVVFHGDAVPVLQKTDTELQAELTKHAEAGVVFVACQRSMRAHRLTTQDLFPFAVEVPSGVAEVVLKQEAGYSYLKCSYDPHPTK